MTLAEVLEAGHFVARSRVPPRSVVRGPCPPLAEGVWWVKENAVPGICIRRKVQPAELAGTLGPQDLSAVHWQADEDHCWCPECRGMRKMLETQDD